MKCSAVDARGLGEPIPCPNKPVTTCSVEGCKAPLCEAHRHPCCVCGVALCQSHFHRWVTGHGETLRMGYWCRPHELADRLAARHHEHGDE